MGAAVSLPVSPATHPERGLDDIQCAGCERTSHGSVGPSSWDLGPGSHRSRITGTAPLAALPWVVCGDTCGVRTSWLGHRAALLGVVLYAALAALSEPMTTLAAVAVLVPAVVVLVAACMRRPSPNPESTSPGVRRATLAWGALALLATAWELMAWLQQPAYNVPSSDHPTISLLLDPVTESGAPRLGVWCCWLYVGYRLVRR